MIAALEIAAAVAAVLFVAGRWAWAETEMLRLQRIVEHERKMAEWRKVPENGARQG